MGADTTRTGKPGVRYSKDRRFEILKRALAARPMSFQEIQELLEVSRATVFRMIEALETTEDFHKEEIAGVLHYRIEPPKVAFRCSVSELVALEVACRNLEMLAGTGILEDIVSLRERIAPALKKSEVPIARDLDRKIFAVPAPGRRRYEDRMDDVNDVMTATLHQQRLDLFYESPRLGASAKAFVFEPYSILLYKQGLYVAGYSHWHKKVIKLALDHCREVTWKRGDSFDYPAKYHPRELVDGAFGMHAAEGEEVLVRIRFAPGVRGYVERGDWHTTQVITPTGDGAVELAMRVRGWTEVKSWLLSFGGQAEVLEPEELRAQMAKEARAMAAMYDAPDPVATGEAGG